ncbi:hypothetical protein A5735_20130 [Mycolicibacter heraklionensis]|nr:hypothetical protein A5735_20130 [Mycolicibacter heraklionensis]
MGRQQFYLEASALRSVADHCDAAAAAIDTASRIRLGELRFHGGTAGRDHVAAGETLRRALQAWVPELTRWSRASTEIAAALRVALVRYGQAEIAAGERLG